MLLSVIAVSAPADEPGFVYPPAARGDQVDVLHGVRVADPYRWLEDPDSEQTRTWIDAQNQLTQRFLARIPQREAIRRRLTELWNFERFTLPVKRGGRYFYTRNDGLQNQSVLYVTERLDQPGRVLLDPNTLSDDGTVALANWEVSDDGRLLAFGLASGGSDWRQWRVLEVDTGRQRDDRLDWIKFSDVVWAADAAGLYYARFDEPAEGEALTGSNYFQKLYYHRLGMPQTDDRLVYRRDDQKEWGFDPLVTDDGRYLIIYVSHGTLHKNQVFYRDLADPDGPVVELIAGFDAEYEFVGNDGPVFYLMTDHDAPRRRLIAVDLNRPQREHWRELIPQHSSVLQHVSLVGETFFARYLEAAVSRIRRFDSTGKPLGQVDVPPMGSVAGFHGRRSDRETFYSYRSFTTPATIYRYDVETGQSNVFRRPRVDFDPADYETKQVFFASRDGTQVPMFITSKKGLPRDGSNPTVLYGYGGFDIPLTPGFSVTNLAWMERGGVFVVANLRGGGEFGREWHEAGMLKQKQNVFDDFIAAAEWLQAHGVTSRQKLAVRGGSNGGLLVGAVMTQRPELFAAALPAVGVMDMLRFHKFTIGWAWTSEFGSPDDVAMFPTLYAYSPLHNLRPGTHYPATLITTADHDDRVVPAHSFKFAAALQAAQAGAAPTLIRIETRAGHGAGTPTSKRIDEATDKLAFLHKVLRVGQNDR